MATQFAARLALIAFTLVTIRGVIDFADFHTTMSSALMTAAAFFGFGMLVGELANRTVEEIAQREFQELTVVRQTPGGQTSDEASPTPQH